MNDTRFGIGSCKLKYVEPQSIYAMPEKTKLKDHRIITLIIFILLVLIRLINGMVFTKEQQQLLRFLVKRPLI